VADISSPMMASRFTSYLLLLAMALVVSQVGWTQLG